MAEMKQLIYAATIEGYRMWGKSNELPWEVDNGNDELFNTFSVPQSVRDAVAANNGIREGVGDIPRRCKYTCVGNSAVLMKTEYIGAEIMNPGRFGNYFMHLYTTAAPTERIPALYFNTPGIFKDNFAPEEMVLKNAPEPLPTVNVLPELSHTVAAVKELLKGDVERRILAAMLCEVIGVLVNPTNRLVFVKCGNGNRLMDWISAVSLLLPSGLVSQLTFDTACGTANGRAPESFAMTDAVTGFIDGISDGELEKCKVYSREYRVYDMTAIESTLGAMNAPAEITRVIDVLFAAESEAETVKVIGAYRNLLDSAVNSFSPALMLETATIADSIVKVKDGDADKLIKIRAACVGGKAESVRDDIAFIANEAFGRGVAAIRDLIHDTADWNGMTAVILSVIKATVTAKEYADELADRLIKSNGAEAKAWLEFFKEHSAIYNTLKNMLASRASEYVTENAALIANGIINNQAESIAEYLNASTLEKAGGTENVYETVSEAALLAVEPMLPQLAAFCVNGEDSENAENAQKLKQVQTFFKAKIEGRLADAVCAYVKNNVNALCEDFVKDANAVAAKLERAEKYFAEAKAVFIKEFTSFIDRDGVGKDYVYSFARSYMETDGGEIRGEYTVIREYTEAETFDRVMEECVRKAAVEQCRKCAEGFVESRGAVAIDGVIECVKNFTRDKEAVQLCQKEFVDALGEEIEREKDVIVRDYLDNGTELADRIAEYVPDFINETMGELIMASDVITAYADGIAEDIMAERSEEAKAKSERLTKAVPDKAGEIIDGAFNRYVERNKDTIVSDFMSGDRSSEAKLIRIAENCSDAIAQIVDTMISSKDAIIVKVAREVFEGDCSLADAYLNTISGYRAEKEVAPIKERLYQKLVETVKEPENAETVIGWIVNGEASKLRRLVEDSLKYGEGLSKEIGSVISEWINKPAGKEKLKAWATVALDGSDAEERAGVEAIINGFKEYARNTLEVKLRIIIKDEILTAERLSELAKEIIDGSCERYNRYAEYGESAVKEKIHDQITAIMERSFGELARAVFENGDDSGIREYIGILENRCGLSEKSLTSFRGAFGAALVKYIRSDAGRMKQLAAEWVEDTERAKLVGEYAAGIREDKALQNEIRQLSTSEIAAITNGMAFGDDYEKWYRKAERYEKGDITKYCAMRVREAFGTEEYRKSDDYVAGILDPTRRPAIVKRLEFFHSKGYPESRGVLESRLTADEFWALTGESIEEVYGRMREDFGSILSEADCFRILVKSYKNVEFEIKRRLEEYIRYYITEAKRTQEQSVGGESRTWDAYCKAKDDPEIKSIFLEIVKDKLSLPGEQIKTEQLMAVYNISHPELRKILGSINTSDSEEKSWDEVKKEPGDVVRSFYDGLNVAKDGQMSYRQEAAEQSWTNLRYRRVSEEASTYVRFCILSDHNIDPAVARDIINCELPSLDKYKTFWNDLCMDGLLEIETAFKWLIALLRQLERVKEFDSDLKWDAKKNVLLREFIKCYGIARINYKELMEASFSKGKIPSFLPNCYSLVQYYNELLGKREIRDGSYRFSALADEREVMMIFRMTVVYMIAKGKISENHIRTGQFKSFFSDAEKGIPDQYGVGSRVNDIFGFLYGECFSEALNEKNYVSEFRKELQGLINGSERVDYSLEYTATTLEKFLESGVGVDEDKRSAVRLFIHSAYAYSTLKDGRAKRDKQPIDWKKQKKQCPEDEMKYSKMELELLQTAVLHTPLPTDIDGELVRILLKIAECMNGDGENANVKIAVQSLLRNYEIAISKKGDEGWENSEEAIVGIRDNVYRGNVIKLKNALARRLALCSVNGEIKNRDLKDIRRCFGEEYVRAMVEFMQRSKKIKYMEKCIRCIENDEKFAKLLCYGIDDFSRMNDSDKKYIKEEYGSLVGLK